MKVEIDVTRTGSGHVRIDGKEIDGVAAVAFVAGVGRATKVVLRLSFADVSLKTDLGTVEFKTGDKPE